LPAPSANRLCQLSSFLLLPGVETREGKLGAFRLGGRRERERERVKKSGEGREDGGEDEEEACGDGKTDGWTLGDPFWIVRTFCMCKIVCFVRL